MSMIQKKKIHIIKKLILKTIQVGGSAMVIPLIRRHLPDLDGPRVIATYARLLAAAVPTVLVIFF